MDTDMRLIPVNFSKGVLSFLPGNKQAYNNEAHNTF